MKTSIKTRFLLPALIVCLAVILPGPVSAQTFTTLHSFDGDGSEPISGLVSTQAVAPSSLSTPMARVLRPCIVFQDTIALTVPTATEPDRSER
jgi:hypothetical protein